MAVRREVIELDEPVWTALGDMARARGLTYSTMVELLVVGELLREKLREEAEHVTVAIPGDMLARIRERLGP